MARGLRNIIVRADMEHGLKPATRFRGRILRGEKGRTRKTLRSMLTHPQARYFEVLCVWNFCLALSPQPQALIKQPACVVLP